MSGKFALIAFILSLSSNLAIAQSNGDLNEDDIVSALRGEKPQATRSLLAQPADTNELSAENRNFLKSVSTRGLRVESIKKAGEIIDSSKLPSLDIEIIFEFDSAVISPEALDEFEALGKALQNQALANVQILLNGHTDAKGDESYNLALSQNRAEAVRARLISDYGIAAERLVAIGFGEERLKDTSDPESTANRRVEVVNIGAE